MKKISSLALSTVFIASTFVAPVLAVTSSPTPTGVMQKGKAAEKAKGLEKKEEVMEVKEEIVKKKSDYALPYPGILPDHPLYGLKALRDQILDAIIIDPLRKGEFYLLQADKRLNMGIFLTERSKGVAAEVIISKGEKYLEKAVNLIVGLKSSGKDVPGYIVERLSKSIEKHIEVLEELVAKASEPQRTGLTASLDLVKKLQGEVLKLK